MAKRFLGAVAMFFYAPGAGTGKVMTSDATGFGTWQTPAASGGSDTSFPFFIA